jgi:hypothetical protein
VTQANCETVMLERNGKVREFKPSAKGKWDVFVSSTMQVNVGDQIRVTAGFREGKNVFRNNDIAEVRQLTDTELVLHDGRRMRRNGALRAITRQDLHKAIKRTHKDMGAIIEVLIYSSDELQPYSVPDPADSKKRRAEA